MPPCSCRRAAYRVAVPQCSCRRAAFLPKLNRVAPSPSFFKREIKKEITTRRCRDDDVNPFLISSFWSNTVKGAPLPCQSCLCGVLPEKSWRCRSGYVSSGKDDDNGTSRYLKSKAAMEISLVRKTFEYLITGATYCSLLVDVFASGSL